MMLMDVLGWALVHTVWEGAVIALVLAVALEFARSAKARYFLACGGLLATLTGFTATVFYLLPADSIAHAATVLHNAPVAAGNGLFRYGSNATHGPMAPRWVVTAWLAGIVLFQLRALGGWVAVWRLRATGVCAATKVWQARLDVLRARLRVGRPVMLLESSLAAVPVVIGHMRPVILMPAGLLMGLPRGQVEAILLHELAHVLRCDYMVNLLQTVTDGLLFYHPAVWWISRTIRAERENCCDDLAVAASGDAHEYAEALTSLAERQMGDFAMAANGGSVVKRVRRLLKQTEGPRAGLGPVLVACGIVVACAVAFAQAQQAPAVQAPQTPYTKWVNEDVRYIIQDVERQAYQRLTTDEEREKFIEQFWLRRDPTPNTPANEFKEEHYRRIAYANDRFGPPSGMPGWKTDMGRVYITYGPPDEREVHPSGAPEKRFPFEQWKYRLIEGVGQNVIVEFDDRDKTGFYRMAMDPAAPAQRDPIHSNK